MVNFFHELDKIFGDIRSLPKSLWFNFHYLNFFNAIRLPILISHRVKLRNLGGSIHINRVKTGTIRIGFGGMGQHCGVVDSVFSMKKGVIQFEGKVRIGCAANIFIHDGTLTIGDNFDASRNLLIMCQNKIHIKHDVLISWNVSIMDHDGHDIQQHGESINPPRAIEIGSQVWIGCNSTILKGAQLAEQSVVGAHAIVTGSFPAHALIAGQPARLVKQDISWQQ
ncbi:MAG: acyltransferase [Zetaproteobacteria bacterium]|nr:acyltransferase [Zetaproteobacteria bacterium]